MKNFVIPLLEAIMSGIFMAMLQCMAMPLWWIVVISSE